MKHNDWKKDKVLILTIISLIIILVLIVSFIISKLYSRANNPSPNRDISSLKEVESEQKALSDIEQVSMKYIDDKPQAKDITVQMEFVGMGYGIMNATYDSEGKHNETKLYLESDGKKWQVIYESEKMITCDKVQELISRDTILSSMCTK